MCKEYQLNYVELELTMTCLKIKCINGKDDIKIMTFKHPKLPYLDPITIRSLQLVAFFDSAV